MSLAGPTGRAGVQNHLTLAFPIRSPADSKTLAEKLPPLMPRLAKASDAIGTVHDSCFVVLSEQTLLFLAAKRQGLAAPAISFPTVRQPHPSPHLKPKKSRENYRSGFMMPRPAA